MHISGQRIFLPVMSACFLSGVGCTGDGSLTVPENTGTIEVTTLTTGTELDPDGYTIQVDDEPPRAITPTGSVQIPEIQAGSHTVRVQRQSPVTDRVLFFRGCLAECLPQLVAEEVRIVAAAAVPAGSVSLIGPGGFEPPLTDPKSAVLPLDEGPVD
jgi:hypothetical protein